MTTTLQCGCHGYYLKKTMLSFSKTYSGFSDLNTNITKEHNQSQFLVLTVKQIFFHFIKIYDN